MDLMPQRGAFSRVLNRLARNTKIVFLPQRGGLVGLFVCTIILQIPFVTIDPRVNPTVSTSTNVADNPIEVELRLHVSMVPSSIHFRDHKSVKCRLGIVI